MCKSKMRTYKSENALRFEYEGYYLPSFYEMYLNTDNAIDINKLSNHDFSVFAHEYIHFIQDVMTTAGLWSTYVSERKFHSWVYFIEQKYQKGDNLPIPIQLPDNLYDVDLCNFNQNLFEGDSCIEDSDIASLDIDDVQIDDVKNNEHPDWPIVKSVIIIDAQKGPITFGKIAVAESMAYLVEQLGTKGWSKSPDFPYSSAELLAKREYPEFATDKKNILALCDCSLMYMNPGLVFYSYLKDAKERNYLPHTPQDIYSDCFKRNKVCVQGKVMEVIDGYSLLANEVKNSLRQYYNNGEQYPIHKTFYKWIDTIIDYAITMRCENMTFILDLVDTGNVRNSRTLLDIINNIGTPLMKNNKEKRYCIPINQDGIDDLHIQVMSGVAQLFSILSSGKTRCDLQDWCKSSKGVSFVDHRCETCPWTRANDKELCPIARIVKNIGLADYNFVRE